MPFQQTRALVTGGTSGIGQAICAELQSRGAQVLTCGTDPGRVEAANRSGLIALRCDLSEPEDLNALVSAARTRLGQIDLLVHCAAIQQTLDVLAQPDPDDMQREVEINLIAPMRLTAALMPLLPLSPPTAIVHVTSVLALTPKQRAPVYCATKAGLATWTVALRQQMEPTGVLVMDLMPPLVKTRMTQGRDAGAVSPEVVAQALIQGLIARQPEVVVGKARLARWLHRVWPALLARKLRHA